MDAPDRFTVPEPAVAVIVPPPQLPLSPLCGATTRLAGKVSVKPIPVRAPGLAAGLLIVKARVEFVVGAMTLGVNDLVIEGGPNTSILAVAVVPLPLSVALMTPVVLILCPGVTPVTFTENEQEPFAGNVPPERLTKNRPEIWPVCTVPPQNEPMTPRGAVDKPVGRLSPNAMFESDTVVLGLVILNVRLVVPPTGMLAAPKFLLNVGGA